MAAFAISMLTLLAACGGNSTGDKDSDQDIGMLVSELVGHGVVVAEGDGIEQPFFSVPGQNLIVDGETVQVFNYTSPEAAQADADLVSPTGSPVGTSMVSWVASPHFYLKDSLLVIYVGNDSQVIGLLETVLGPQFAGAEAPVEDPTSNTDAVVQSYLALMDELTSVLSRFSARGDLGPSSESITLITSQLENYSGFFAAMDGEQRDYMIETYGDDLRQSADRVATIAMTIQATTDDETIAQALVRIPAFAIANTTTSGTGDPTTVPSGY